MKTKKTFSVKSLTAAMLATTLLIFTACGAREGKSEKGQESPDSEVKIKPPSMDIHTATFMDNLDAVRQHIKAGTDLNQKDAYGSSPLIIAATFGKTEVAKALIEAGADLTLTNNDGSTPLHIAAFFCRVEIVEVLLNNGADKSLKNNFGSTALESVSGPFDSSRGIYDQLSKDLGPLGLKFDYEYLETTRPRIAEMLR